MPPLTPRPAERRAFGARVRALRRTHGLSQEQLAERAHMSRKTIGRLESGENSVLLDRIFALADALEVEAAELFRWDTAPSG